MTAVLIACLLGCVVALGWPRAGALARLSGDRQACRLGGLPWFRVPERCGTSGVASATGFRWREMFDVAGVAALGRRGVLGVAAVAALAGLLAGGPVAALIGAAYAGLGTAEWVRRARRKQVAAGRAAALAGLSGAVADLRAGLPPATVPAGALDGDRRIGGLTGAVWRLAERTGAPAADLLERIETDARAADRAAASASAQAAGAHATSLLLAALPVGGIGLGYSIGARPLHVLLHTPLGAACAVAAVLLQCAGLWWARRLVEGAR
ncbi:hypothetical protein [Actinoplanes sp. NPDC020271]|uniref:hypothetical protein n=1 Tax=Actinoplanes sp. NPDC020271 TaxID=3363896 RepID=UPI0037BC3676